MSDFFEPPPCPEPDVETVHEDWMGPPPDVVPAVAPVERVLARTEGVAVFVSGCFAYPAGFEFRLSIVMRGRWRELDPFDFGGRPRSGKAGEIPPEQLRVGLQFADGSKATNTGGDFGWVAEGEPSSPTLIGLAGSGGEGEWHQGYWVWPLPPPGPMAFVCEWPAAEIPLTRSELDAAPIIAAASRAQRVFGD